MKPKRYLSAVFLAAVVAVLSCTADPATGPQDLPEPSADLVGELARTAGLLQCSPLPHATATETIGPAGGSIKVGPHVLVIPPKALKGRVTITATAPSGEVNQVQFQPEGLRFRRSAALTMSYANCKGAASRLHKRIAYTNDLLEILYYLPSVDDLERQRVTGELEHFSTYAVAW